MPSKAKTREHKVRKVQMSKAESDRIDAELAEVLPLFDACDAVLGGSPGPISLNRTPSGLTTVTVKNGSW